MTCNVRVALRRSAIAALFFVIVLFTTSPTFAAGAVLTHRYPFDTNVDDVVGGANGILTNGAFVTNGAVVFTNLLHRVQLPADMFTNYDSISFEVWFVEEGTGIGTTVLYGFANCCNNSIGMFCTPTGTGSYNSRQVVAPAPPVMAITNHLVWTQDSNSHTARIYLNGLLAAEDANFTNTPALIGSTPNSWIGWRGATPPLSFLGRILEFRSYSNALSPTEVIINDAAGPDRLSVVPGNLQGIRLLLRTNIGPGALLPVNAFADYENLSNVNILGQSEIILSSDNTDVAFVTNNVKVRTVGYGTANITLSYLGFSNTVLLTVSSPQDFALAHRYSLGESTPSNVVHDSVGFANARPFGVFLTSGHGNFAGQTYVDLPDGLVSSLSEVSLEAWVTPTNAGFYPRIFDFGDTAGGIGQSYIYMTWMGGNYVVAAISTNGVGGETPRRLVRTNALTLNVQSHVAMTYSSVRGMMKLYVNGLPVDSAVATIPLALVRDTNSWLGKSQFSLDSGYNGNFNEFRIYDGFLSDADIAADYAAGPDVVGVDYSLFSTPSGGNLTLSWRPPMAGWILRSSPELGPAAVWTDVGIAPTFQNGRYSVAVQTTNAPLYFRLFAPD